MMLTEHSGGAEIMGGDRYCINVLRLPIFSELSKTYLYPTHFPSSRFFDIIESSIRQKEAGAWTITPT